MTKNLFLFLFFTFTQVGSLFAQAQIELGKAEKTRAIGGAIDLEWKNLGVGYTQPSSVIELMLRIKTPVPIGQKQIRVLINGTPVSAKADEVTLIGGTNDANYRNIVQLEEGTSKIEVEVKSGGRKKASETKWVMVKNGVLTVLNHENMPTANKIIWMSPVDPVEVGGIYPSSSPIVSVKLRLNTALKLDFQHIKLYLNGMAESIGNSTLTPTDGGFIYKKEVTLDSKVAMNEVFVKVQVGETVFESDKLKIDYSTGRPNLYVMSIGPELNLKYTVKDALDFAGVFAQQGGKLGNKLFNSVQIDTLVGNKATTAEIQGKLEDLKTKASIGQIKDNDVIILFISSHGFILNDELRIQGSNYSSSRQKSTSISYKDAILDVLDAIPCKKLIFIDACHSGIGARSGGDVSLEIQKLNAVKRGTVVISSSQSNQESYEDDSWQNGAFTHAIIKGLRDEKADTNANGFITVNELFQYVSKEVTQMVKSKKNKDQSPMLLAKDWGDISIYAIF